MKKQPNNEVQFFQIPVGGMCRFNGEWGRKLNDTEYLTVTGKRRHVNKLDWVQPEQKQVA